MTPTPKLRFVSRTTVIGNSHTVSERILQQWWVKEVLNTNGEAFETDVGEWRDVPLEEEV